MSVAYFRGELDPFSGPKSIVKTSLQNNADC